MLKQIILVTVVLLAIFSASAKASTNEKTGDNLPDIVKIAIGIANEMWFNSYYNRYEQNYIKYEHVVVFENVNKFCSERNISVEKCKLVATANVLEDKYPIYINADGLNTKSTFWQIHHIYFDWKQLDIVDSLAAQLIHENLHVFGEKCEIMPYFTEKSWLEQRKKNKRIYADPNDRNYVRWYPDHLRDTEKNVKKYTTDCGRIQLK